MFNPISIEDYEKRFNEINSNTINKPIRELCEKAVEAKKNGAKCVVCGEPIWALGSATVGWKGCFTCIAGETDNSEDLEIDSVCY